MENILDLQQVCKTFPKSGFALDKVSFSVPCGAIMGFVGENGAGKTTTIGCILKTVSKDSGRIIKNNAGIVYKLGQRTIPKIFEGF